MATEEVWLGNLGPFLYDSEKDLPNRPGEKPYGIRTSGRIRAADAEEDGEVITRRQTRADFVLIEDIVDDLDSSEQSLPLSANQGRILNETKLTIESNGNVDRFVQFTDGAQADTFRSAEYRSADNSAGITTNVTLSDGTVFEIKQGLITNVIEP